MTEAETALTDFRKENVTGVESGVKEVGAMLMTIHKAMGDCDIVDHLKKLEAMASIFESPITFAYHLGKDIMVNGIDIFNEIEKAITDYD